MSWQTTRQVGRFLAETGRFMASDPVANTVLLTEAHYWLRLTDPPPGASFGWWHDRGEARGAFVHIPHHAVLCSPLSPGSAAELPRVLTTVTTLGVQARDVAAVTAAWRAQSKVLRPRRPIALLRLRDLRPRALPDGAPRLADDDDLPLLRTWFQLFRERHPDDPSSVEYVVDQPLVRRCLMLWELGGRPVAMASRTPEVAGMVRMGLAFQPINERRYAEAAFDAACVQAARTAEHVLVLCGTPEVTAEHQSLGFEPVLDRVVLDVSDH